MIKKYLSKLQLELITGSALEHSYRPALKDLCQEVNPNIQAINEPSRSIHGSPDFVFLKKNNPNIILGYVEAKDVWVNLDDIEKTEQLKRYLGYSNLILTNYIEFRFFRNGEKYQSIKIADKFNTFLKPIEENYPLLINELRAFLEGKSEKIKNGKRLAVIMGGKALRIRENIKIYLNKKEERNNELEKIFNTMRELLVHDLNIDKFADMYAQTLVYGLFIARYYDKTPDTFSRSEARDLIPASNPFLQKFFDHIAGMSFDKRLGYIVDELCEVFSIANIQEIVQKHFDLFGEVNEKDPIIHFYEDFLKEYDPILKKSMGAYYTPVPVVQFMIRAVDEILKNEFNLQGGISNTDKIQKEVIVQGKKGKETFHKVQILDPAVGTATFLNEIIKYIHKGFGGQEGSWKSYVEKELLPRLCGFELMMAPYTIAHLKLATTLKETGIDKLDHRLGVYLTNTLEEGIKHNNDLFSLGLIEAISKESEIAGRIKNERPIMVIIGNPPYSGESNNKGLFEKEIDVYKQEPTGGKLKERNSKWINDDYVKFIRFSEQMIEKNGEGIVAMITNNGYIDNPTFRGMRWHLINTFNKVYILDLHGNSKKKEVAKDGGKDENVFDIQQGVSIIVAVKQKNRKNKFAEVFKSNIWGKREVKFENLNKSIDKIRWEEITLTEPYYLFLNRNIRIQKKYEKGIKINELFPKSTVGIVTSRDEFVIDSKKEILRYRIECFLQGHNEPTVRESINFNFEKARSISFTEDSIKRISYRPFDDKYIYYQSYYVERKRNEIMQNFINKENIGLITVRQVAEDNGFSHAFLSKNIIESRMTLSNKGICYYFPLYIYSSTEQSNIDSDTRKVNLNKRLVEELLNNIGTYKLVEDHGDKKDITQISPLDILDYLYAILYSPKYRETYGEFLKTDFPRIPPAKNSKQFFDLVELGKKLRTLHLMEDIDINNFSTTFSITGENVVEKTVFNEEKVWINDLQHFGNVPRAAWDFYIGGYQPAQKWLKDRKGKSLSYEDVKHYQKIINILSETIHLMKKIDEIDFM